MNVLCLKGVKSTHMWVVSAGGSRSDVVSGGRAGVDIEALQRVVPPIYPARAECGHASLQAHQLLGGEGLIGKQSIAPLQGRTTLYQLCLG